MSRTTIVLGCARSKRPHLAPVVEVLAGRGNPVEVVSGLDDNDGPWADAIARLGNTAVYVLCSDERVNLRRVGRLRQMLAGSGIPPARSWCGPIDWSEPTQILRNVEHLLESRPPTSGPVPVPPFPQPPRAPSEMSGSTVLPPSMASHEVAPTSESGSLARTYYAAFRELSTTRWKPAAIVAAVAILVVAAAVPALGASDDEAPEPVDVAAAPPSVQSVARPAEPPPAPAPIPVEAPLPEVPVFEGDDAADRDAIFAALQSQEIRALDILLIGPEATTASSRGYKTIARLPFEDARLYCEDLEIEGLRGWRLPSVGELASLSSNKMLGKGAYWSDTEGDSFGNNRLVWSVSNKRMKPMRQEYKGARTVCVRHLQPKAE
jgi:hypothetical protein